VNAECNVGLLQFKSTYEAMTQVVCVIVNFRTPDLTVNAIKSVLRDGLAGCYVCVVDNASGDQSSQIIATAIEQNNWFDSVQFCQAPYNGGFAFGCNLGVRAASKVCSPKFVMFLNPDAQMPYGALGEFTRLFERDRTLGIVGATISSPDGTVQSAPNRFPSPKVELLQGARVGFIDKLLLPSFASEESGELTYCDWVSGACFAVRSSLLQSLGGLDEQYFLYFEEVDFCWRAKRASWKVAVTSTIKAIHEEGASTGITSVIHRRPPYWLSALIFFGVRPG
jgi:N-acetylglucosaminyl-diphospho-decaprenol L-rhamnosyltransferase